MKKKYIFILFLFIIGCGSNELSKKKSTEIACPDLFFSAEHKRYLGGNFKNSDFNDITFSAEINNADFIEGCKTVDNSFSSNLSLLFIATPLEKTKKEIKLPFYLALIDKNKKLLDMQYYTVTDVFDTDIKNNTFVETELDKKIKIFFNSEEKIFAIVIGFMLDEQRNKIFN